MGWLAYIMAIVAHHLKSIKGGFQIPRDFRFLLHGTINLLFLAKEGCISGWPASIAFAAPIVEGMYTTEVELCFWLRLPEKLASLAGIKDRIVFLGDPLAAGCFELWNERRWRNLNKSERK
jgi:hypothetical protein